MAIEKDESINKREVVVVSYLSFQVSDMIAEAALKDAGMIMAPGVSIEIDFMMHGKDSLGYERKTEGLATGARVKITVDRDFKPTIHEPSPAMMEAVDFAGKPEPYPEFKDNGRDHPEPKPNPRIKGDKG